MERLLKPLGGTALELSPSGTFPAVQGWAAQLPPETPRQLRPTERLHAFTSLMYLGSHTALLVLG